MIQITDEYREIANKYKKTFGYGVPLSMIPPTVEMHDLISNIEKCIIERKDTLLDHYSVRINKENLF